MRPKSSLLALAVLFAGVPQAALAAERPAGGAARLLTPDRLIAMVLRENPNLAAAEEAAIAAAERVRPAGALDDPMFSYSIAPETIGRKAFETGQGAELSQLLPWPGKLGARREAARERANAAGASAESQRLRVVAATKAAFAEWYFVHQALRLNRENKEILDDLRGTAESRFAAGRGLQQDALQADTELALLEDRDLALEQKRTEIRARLNKLMNRPADARLAPPAGLDYETPLPPLPSLVADMPRMHPELRALEHLTAEKEAALRLARKERFPDFRLSGKYDTLWDEDEKRFTAGVSVNIPLNQSRRRDEESAARAERRQAEWLLADRLVELQAAIVRVYADAERAGKSVRLHRGRLLPLAQSTLEAATSEYESGAGDFLAVIAAERNKLKIEQSFHRALADRYRQLAQLELWLGGPVDPAARQGGSR